jgi:hypothetical protein
VETQKKDFLEQLRLINLSVIATCLLLFVGASFQSSGALDSAYSDARSIRLNASRFVSWLQGRPLDLKSQLNTVLKKEELFLYHGRKKLSFEVDFPLDELTVPGSDRSAFPLLNSRELAAFKGTLASFREVWDLTYALSNGLVITNWEPSEARQEALPYSVEPAGHMPVPEAQKPATVITLLPNDAAIQYEIGNDSPPSVIKLGVERDTATSRWMFVADFDAEWYRESTSNAPYHSYNKASSPFRVLIPLDTKPENQNVQGSAIESLRLPWIPGRFQESFPDLSRLSKGLDSLSLEQLEDHIGELRASGSDSVEIFGAKLPVDFLRTWGILILFGVQLYYYLHIRQYHDVFGSERTEPSFPWIACYESKVSRFVYLASVTVLPVATAVFLPLSQRSEFRDLKQFTFACCAVSASLLASVLTWKEVDRAT